MRPALSLITGTLNRKESFHRLLKSIQERTDCSWELVVSDASDPPYYTSHLPPNVKVLPERPRQGCVKGYNRAFKAAIGQWVIFLNDDAEVMPGYARASIEFMEAHPEIGLGALYYVEETLPYHVNEWCGMGYANFGILSRELGEKIGWMDEVVKKYGNDNSIAFRVLLQGKGIASIPGARIWHHRVLDKWKVDDFRLQPMDAQTLLDKYRPMLPTMKAVFDRTAHLFGPMVLES